MARGQRNTQSNGSDKFEEDPPRATAPNGQGNNSDATVRDTELNKAIEEWCDLQDHEDKLLEKHIEPVRKNKHKISARLKADFEIPTQAFNARAQLRRIERMTDNDEVVLALNELFKATPVGNNLDLVELAARIAEKRAEKEAAKSKGKSVEAEA